MINPLSKTSIPTEKASKGTTSGMKVDFGAGKNAYYVIEIDKSKAVSGEIHNIAKLLVEHMDIIEDSREQIKHGNTVTWDEFKKTNTKKRE